MLHKNDPYFFIVLHTYFISKNFLDILVIAKIVFYASSVLKPHQHPLAPE